jgi:hypothetical protein
MFILAVGLIVFDSLALDTAINFVSHTADCSRDILDSAGAVAFAASADIISTVNLLKDAATTVRLLLILATVFTSVTFVKYMFKGMSTLTNEFLETQAGQLLMYLTIAGCVVVHVLLAGVFCVPLFADLFARLEIEWLAEQAPLASSMLLLPGACDLTLYKKLQTLVWLAFGTCAAAVAAGQMLLQREVPAPAYTVKMSC